MKALITYLMLCLIGLGGCGLLGGGGNSPPIPGKIIFSAKDAGGTYQIFTMNSEGSNVRQLTEGKFFSVSPAWSPDGQHIAFATNRQAPDGSTTLWVMDADGSNLEPLVFHPQTGRPMFGNHPAWSPDGSKLAFDYCINCELFGRNYEIFLVDLQTGTLDTLVQNPAGDGSTEWSPAGERILFSSNRDYIDADSLRFRNEIYSISLGSKEAERITFSKFPKSAGGKNWLSPDSISYIQFDLNTNLKDLIVLDLESGAQHPLLSNLQVSQFWTFWDPADRRFLSIEKKHDKVPVTLILFDLDGDKIEEIKLKDPILESAVGFKWRLTQ